MADGDRVLLPLDRRATFRLVLWGALDGMAVGVVLFAIVTVLTGAQVEAAVVIRLLGPLGLLVGGVAARIRAPAMGVIADDDGVELHGYIRTRRHPWADIAAVGWAAPRRRVAIQLHDSSVKAGPSRLPRRVPGMLGRLAGRHGSLLILDRTLRSGTDPSIEVAWRRR